MTDYSPAGSDERAELDRATLRALDTHDRSRPTPTASPPRCSASAWSSTLEEHDAGERLRDLRVLGSPVQSVRMVFDLMPRDTADDWQVIAERLALVPQTLASIEAGFTEGVAQGIVAARRQAVGVRAAGRHLGRRRPDHRRRAAVLPRARRRVRRVAGIGDAALGTRLRELATRATEAYARARPLPRRGVRAARRRSTMRSDASGTRCTRATSTASTLDLDETYAWGWDELHRIEHAMGQVAERIVPGATVDEVIEHLEHDPTRTIDGVDDVPRVEPGAARHAPSPSSTARTSTSPTPVKRVEAMIAPPGGAAAMYYTGPSEDFSRPGRTWYPTLGKTTFPLWGEVSICYHEGVPGHHLQIAQVRYLADVLSRYQRTLAGTSGHAEGWALYAERLMGELGYLEDPAYELGMLRAQAMRAVRVVVDIGMHLELAIPAHEPYHPGETWTPELALPFVIERSKFPPDFMASEVDRYLGLPGQAISYKVGERVLAARRATTPRAAAARVRPQGFHRPRARPRPMGLGQLERELARL